MAQKETVYYRDLSGGQNSDSAPDILADNQLSEARNASFSKLGAVSKRYAFRPLNATSYGKTVNRIIPWLRFAGTETLLAVMTDGAGAVTLNLLDPTTYAPTALCTLAKADIGWFTWQDKFYFGDGAVYRRYDGTTAIQVVPSKPGTPSVVDGPGIGGSLNSGVHYWHVTFVNEDDVESEASGTCWVNVAATNRATLTIPTAPAGQGVTKRKIYRSAAGFAAPRNFLVEINDNTTTTYVDTTADASLGAQWVAPTRDLTAVHRCNRFVFHPHSQRAFASGDSTDPGATYFSDGADVTEWRTGTSPWTLYSSSALGSVVNMSVFGDSLAVHYNYGHMRWKGTDPATDLTWYQVPVNMGPASAHATCLVPNALAFAARGGVQLVNPAALETDYILQPGESIVSNVLKGKATGILSGAYSLANASAAYDTLNSRYMLAFQDVLASGANDSILVIDWTLGAVSVWDGVPCHHMAQTKDGEVLVASDNYVLKLTSGDYADWNTATGAEKGIEFSVTTKAYDLGYPLHRKKVSRLYIAAEQSTASQADVLVDTEGDSATFSNVDLSGTESQELYEAKCSLKGDRFSVTVSDDTIDAPVSIHGIGFRLKALTPKGTKVTEVEEA